MRTAHVKQGDTMVLSATLQGADGVAQGLTGAVVVFSMRSPATPTAASVVVVNEAACTVLDAAGGTVRYRDETAGRDATVTAGHFLAEFEATLSDGTVLTFPNDRDIPIVIAPQVA